jgi:hypothetical protein
MRVYIAFEFEGVEADSEMADTILNDVTKSCETMRIGLGADLCWVDDAQNTEEMDSFNDSFKK